MASKNSIVYNSEMMVFSIPRAEMLKIFNIEDNAEVKVIPRLYTGVLINAFAKHHPGAYGSNGHKFTKRDGRFVFELYCMGKVENGVCGKVFKLSCAMEEVVSNPVELKFKFKEQLRDCVHYSELVSRPLSGNLIRHFLTIIIHENV